MKVHMSHNGGRARRRLLWGVEEILRAVPGVIATDVGYTGGSLENLTLTTKATAR